MLALTNQRNIYDDWDWISWKQINNDEFTNLSTNINKMWKITKIENKHFGENATKIKSNSYAMMMYYEFNVNQLIKALILHLEKYLIIEKYLLKNITMIITLNININVFIIKLGI